MPESYAYPGEELDLFQHATNWKAYFAKRIRPYLTGSVLEVGAGIGATTASLNNGTARSWTALEPDGQLVEKLRARAGSLPANTQIRQGLLSDIHDRYDTIIYIDVLEHIEKDAEELKTAAAHLNPGGHIIVLSPAFQYLYSPFDKSIGHYRRYSKKMLRDITPSGLSLTEIFYLDSMGFFASVANHFFLKQKYPSLDQVKFWDRNLIPVSKLTDTLLFHSFGKTIIAIWTNA